MQVEPLSIKKFKRSQWFDKKKNKIFYGINVVMTDRKEYPVKESKNKPYFFDTIPECNKKVRELNQSLKQSLTPQH